MRIDFRIVELRKRYPLSISRGTSTGSNNLFATVESEGVQGLGECAPGTGHDDNLADLAQSQLEDLAAQLDSEVSPCFAYRLARERGLEPPAIAALDMALWDLLAKKAGLPLYRLLGLDRSSPITSVTIGINPPDVVRERSLEVLRRTDAKALKVKLGSADGPDADKEIFLSAKEAASTCGAMIRADANGGWNPEVAVVMMRWLAENGCQYIEQPLAKGQEAELPRLFEHRPLPIFVDESVHFSEDVPPISKCVDGVNIKLMKCGGITEALRIIATARAHGLQTMIGCMGESSVAISAAASLGCLMDFVDLDSQINLAPDPATGAQIVDGVVLPLDIPGHGARLLV